MTVVSLAATGPELAAGKIVAATVAGAPKAAPQGVHIVLGLRAFGLEQTAAKVGGQTLLNNPAWRQALADAIANPASRFTVSVEGLSGSSVYSQVMGAIARPGASATNWELAQLAQAGRLGQVAFVDRLGRVLVNPFGL